MRLDSYNKEIGLVLSIACVAVKDEFLAQESHA
jgi:hypothetical protein